MNKPIHSQTCTDMQPNSKERLSAMCRPLHTYNKETGWTAYSWITCASNLPVQTDDWQLSELLQSLSTLHVPPAVHFREHDPPQSVSVSSPSFTVFLHRSKFLVCMAPVKGIKPTGFPELSASHTEMLALITRRDAEPEVFQIGTVHVIVWVEFGDTDAELVAVFKLMSKKEQMYLLFRLKPLPVQRKHNAEKPRSTSQRLNCLTFNHPERTVLCVYVCAVCVRRVVCVCVCVCVECVV